MCLRKQIFTIMIIVIKDEIQAVKSSLLRPAY